MINLIKDTNKRIKSCNYLIKRIKKKKKKEYIPCSSQVAIKLLVRKRDKCERKHECVKVKVASSCKNASNAKQKRFLLSHAVYSKW